MTVRVDKIIIVGGGIGGLGAGLALQRRGFRVAIFERAREMREIGAGVAISPNGRRALRDLGIDEALESISFEANALNICNYATGDRIREHSNDAIRQQQGLGVLQVHRGDLHRLLKEALLSNDPECLHPGHEFVALEQDDRGVTASFANGASARGDVLIGADGNTSTVRSFLFPEEPPVFNGQVAFRAVVPDELVPDELRAMPNCMYPAPGRYLMHYPLRSGQMMNVIGVGQAREWEEEGWSIPTTPEDFDGHYADLAPAVRRLIRNIPEGSLFKWGLRDREPLERWTVGRVTMLGDAAHPMTPFLGQGANLALEDGMVLGRAFAQSESIDEALRRYEGARQPRTSSIQLVSREQGKALQNPSLRWRSPEELGYFDYDPVTVAI